MQTTGFNSWRSWIVAIACLIIYLVTLVPIRLSGLLYVVFMEHYNISREAAAYPVLISIVLRCLIGPLISYLGETFGCRKVTFLGCLLAGIGFGACSFTRDITTISINLGLIYGLGLSLCSTLIPVIIKQHFNKNLSKANGVCLLGSALSALVMGPIYEHCLTEYGVEGAFLLTSGVILNSLPAAMLLKNPKYTKVSESGCELLEKNNKNTEYSSSIKDEHKRYLNTIEIEEHKRYLNTIEIEEQTVEADQRDGVDFNLLPKSNTNNSITNANCSHPNLQIGLETNNLNTSMSNNKRNKVRLFFSISSKKDITNLNKQIKSANIGQSNSEDILNCSENETCRSVNKIHQSIEEFHEIASSKSSKDLNRHITVMNSLKIFADPTYIIIILLHASHNFVLAIIWTIMIDLARDKMILRSQEIFFIMFLPVAEFLGYIGLGWITDDGYLTITNFCSICFILLAAICGYLVWSYSFITMLIGILFFGVFSSTLTTSFTPLVYESIDEKYHSMALSSRFILHGVTCLGIGKFIGYFRDNFGSYDVVLYISALLCLISTIMVKFLPHLASCTANKKKKLEK